MQFSIHLSMIELFFGKFIMSEQVNNSDTHANFAQKLGGGLPESHTLLKLSLLLRNVTHV